MPIITKYLFVASMDVEPEKADRCNEVYDTEHVPKLLRVPGVHAVTRIKGEPFAVSIGGAAQQVAHTGLGIAPSTRSRGRTCSSAWHGPRRSNGDAGPGRSGPTPATGGTRSTRSASDCPNLCPRAASTRDVMKKARKRRPAGGRTTTPAHAEHPNHVWSCDIAHDETRDGQRLQCLTVLEAYARECLAIHFRGPEGIDHDGNTSQRTEQENEFTHRCPSLEPFVLRIIGEILM